MSLRAIMVGVGGWGGTWCRDTLPRAIQEGLLCVEAIVDRNPEALAIAAKQLHLTKSHCYSTLEQAIEEVSADICIIAAPPETHKDLAVMAMKKGLHVLCEKPIAPTLEETLTVAQTAETTGRKMGITMTHRFRQPIWTLRERMNSNEYGKLDYLVFHFTWNQRQPNKNRKITTPDTMLIEGAVHHLDLLEALAGAPCQTLFANTWTPSWGNYAGSAQALMNLQFENGVKALYESAWCNASAQYRWEQEYIRAEFEHATLVLNKKEIMCFEKDKNPGKECHGVKLRMLEKSKWGNDYLLHQFIEWVNGGEAMETNVMANTRSVLLTHAALASSQAGMPISIRQFADGHGYT